MNIETLRDFCLDLPGTTEDVKWGTLCFMIEDKIFIMINLEEGSRFSIKCDVEDFEALTGHPAINQAYHLAKRHWIQVEHFEEFDDKRIKQLILQSRKLVLDKLSKKVQGKYAH
ncbi:MAG: MmcQ/YjbR family DNA-binding protein [Pedobacter sp.]|nr:MmcQ/YjbR family DNA-binding protein [Pedobacter sp.]